MDLTLEPYGYVAGSPLDSTDPSGMDFWGGLQNEMVWVGQHLPGPVRDKYVEAVAWTGNRAGEDYQKLHSSDPSQWVQPVTDALTVAVTVTGMYGGVRLIGGCALQALFADAAEEGSAARLGQLNMVRVVLQTGGRGAVEALAKKTAQRLAEYEAKLAAAKAAGEYTSAIESQIVNFR